ncbi:MAG: Iron-containing alcohol dehydrogenase [Devosia sp.]|uniref:iron-containing alcohol dehydrogenase n=1 Tax=Devosia sp. TaxID=1871048 RepID=UPI002609BB1A|nr:iron-containing alcohol dehydrogenase [Devosia sp.]MDB5528152.1 Iron-containing alcohol dehydrogenase [Devosia sp.]
MTPIFAASRLPRNLVFGAGQRAALAGYVAPLGKRALLVTDERFAGAVEFNTMVDQLRQAGIAVDVYDRTVAELPASCILDGLEHGKRFGADVVVGVGGGSCLDAAKMIALLLSHGGQPSDYYGEFKIPGPILPLVAVPTTAGTGSEVTPVAVIADPDRAVKVGIASPHLIPHTAICDPELTYTCPPGLTAVSGADALTHAIEAFTTLRRAADAQTVHEHVFVGKNAFSDQYALQAIRLISGSLKAAYDNGADHGARERLMMGATLAGLAFGTAGTAAAHAVQYPVGALTHTPHGAGVAVMMPYVLEFNRSHAEAEMAEIADAMGVASAGMDQAKKASAAIDAVAALFAAVGIPKTLKDLGLREEDLTWTAEAALGATRLIKNNPRPLDTASMTQLVNAAFVGDRAALRGTVKEPA